MSGPVTLSVQNAVAVIEVDNPPVNALSHAVRTGLRRAIAQARANTSVKVVVLIGRGRTFIAGADIREFGKPPLEPLLPTVVDDFENCDKPVVAVIHGAALGGGLELALGCHYRVALSGARLGLPEVTLGILPGAGGTQRAPRLIGVEAALDLMISGRSVAADEACRIGLIDELASGHEPIEIGLALAERAFSDDLPVRRTRDLNDQLSHCRPDLNFFDRSRDRVIQKMRGQIAPLKCVDAIQASLEMPFDQAVQFERKLFNELMQTPQRQGLVHAFFSERRVSRIPEVQAAGPREIRTVGIVGGGTMGAGIAATFMSSGIPITMVERDEEGLKRGHINVKTIYDEGVRRGKISERKRDTLLTDLFFSGTSVDALSDVDLVIEAAFEDMSVKKQIFGQLDVACKSGAILATNTSYLDINEIAGATSRPSDVIGLHFFSPAHLMRLMEIVVAGQTAPEVTASAFAVAKRLGKVAVRAGVCDGFIGNRILSNYRKCADYMVVDGASPYEIDKAIVNFGFPMGPYAVSDLAGLDISWATRKRRSATRDPRARYVAYADRLCEQGMFGRKTGSGYYLYGDEVPSGRHNPIVEKLIEEERRAHNIHPRVFSQDDIIRRYVAAMVNEGSKVLEDGIAMRPLDIDVTMLLGYGFPRWRGGPMKFADMTGLASILADIRLYAEEDPYFWEPADLLVELVKQGREFESLNS